MDRFLVTGAMGFIGSHWCEHLLRLGKHVIGLDLGARYPHLLDYPNFIFVADSVKNERVLETLINQVDCVCHFAGIANPSMYVREPRKVIDITALASLQLVELCRLKNKLLLYTSTSEVYGKSTEVPFREDGDRILGSTNTHRWCYSTSKALVEHQIGACNASGELDFVIVRLFNVYGPRLTDRVVSNFVDAAVNDRPLIIHGDGRQTRAFTYVSDVMEAFYALIDRQQCWNRVFNIGDTKETEIIELAEIIREICNPDIDIIHVDQEAHYGTSYEDIPRRTPCIDRIVEHTGWRPQVGLREGVARLVEHVRRNDEVCVTVN